MECIRYLLKDVWYVKFNEEKVIGDPGVLKGARLVEDILLSLYGVEHQKKPLDQRLVLDNYIGGMQHSTKTHGSFGRFQIDSIYMNSAEVIVMEWLSKNRDS